MVVLSLIAMIILTGLFQSMNPAQGLHCYQCNHPGTSYRKAVCESKNCDEDPFHLRIKQRFRAATGEMELGENAKGLLQLEEYCYLKIDRPIPFDGHSRGCYIHLNFKNKSKRTELEHHPVYEEWLLCRTDNCNDMDIPQVSHEDERSVVVDDKGQEDQDQNQDEEEPEKGHNESSASSSLYNSSLLQKLPYVLTMVLILTINFLRCSYYLV